MAFDALRMLNLIETPIWVHDFERNGVAWCNDAAVKFWNAPDREELMAREFAPVSEGARRQLELLRRRVEAGEKTSLTYTLYPGGEPKQISLQIAPWHLEDGRLAMVMEAIPMPSGGASDPGFQRAVEALRHTRDMIALYNEEGTPILANPAMEVAFGEGVPLVKTFETPEDVATLKKELETNDAMSRRFRAPTRSGMGWHMVTPRFATDPVTGERVLMVIREDITDRVRTDGMKDDFISIVSHELRTPLTSIIGSLDLLASGACGVVPVGMDQMLTIARRNSARLLRQVSDLLDLQKMVAGRLELKVSDIRPVELLKRTVEDAAGLEETHGVTFEVVGEVGHPNAIETLISADEGRLAQVLTNLIGNAAKFSPEGAVVQVGLTLATGNIRFWVSDQGPGVPEEFRATIFERFTQAEQLDTRQTPGTGLGLFICKSIVDAHGGTIDFTSSPKGSTFFFEVPRIRIVQN